MQPFAQKPFAIFIRFYFKKGHGYHETFTRSSEQNTFGKVVTKVFVRVDKTTNFHVQWDLFPCKFKSKEVLSGTCSLKIHFICVDSFTGFPRLNTGSKLSLELESNPRRHQFLSRNDQTQKLCENVKIDTTKCQQFRSGWDMLQTNWRRES